MSGNQLPIHLMIAVVAIAAFTASTPACADQAPGDNGKPAVGQPERVICRTIEETGSRLKVKRTCLTKAQWDDQRQLNRQQIENGQTRMKVGSPEG